MNSEEGALKTLTITLATLTAMIVLPCSAQTQQKAAEQSAPATDPLSSFKLIVGKFNTFFAAGPRKAIMKTSSGYSPTGEFVIEEYSAQDIAYDVEKTNSLVSPYSATIQMNIIGKANSSCGDLKHAGVAYGWSSVKGALSAIDRAECYRYTPIEGKPTVYAVKLVFAFQDGRWVFKDAIQTEYANRWLLGQSLFGNETYPMTRFLEPEAQALNSVWRDLVEK